MKFFVPGAPSLEAAESLWQVWRQDAHANPLEPRIFKVQTIIEGQPFTFEVGHETHPKYGGTIVLAIYFNREIQRFTAYAWGRGVSLPGEYDEGPIWIGGRITTVEYFEQPSEP